MPLTLSIARLRRNRPPVCGLNERIANLRRVLPDVAEGDPVPLRTWWDLPTTSVEDRVWSLHYAVSPPLMGRVLAVRFLCLAARRVLHLTREQDRAVSLAAIQAAEAWAADPSEERADVAAAARNDVAAAAVSAAYGCAAADIDFVRAIAAMEAAIDAARVAAYGDPVTARSAHRAVCDYNAEREAQRADLDRLLAEVS